MEYKYGLSDKIIAYLTLISGLVISAVAVWYSVAGLVSIFAASAFSIIIMGVALEASKLVATVWLKWNWKRAPRLIKIYLISAISILMLITSMGIFGYLSKAHLDQNIVSGDVQARISLVDEKIKIERENIANAQQVIKQMDAAVNGVLATGDQEVKLKDGSSRVNSAAERSLQIRRSQAKDREALTKQIEVSQARIVKLQEEIAPVRAEMRKVEAEVGPIKYIAKLIYGDQTDQNMLEKAVTWVIIIIVLVFDPLAVVLLLSSQYSFQWFRQQEEERKNELVQETTPPENTGEEAPPPSQPVIGTVDEGSGGEQSTDKESPITVNVDENKEIKDIPVLENEELWSQRVIDEANSKLAEIEKEVIEPDLTDVSKPLNLQLIPDLEKELLKKDALSDWNQMIAEAEKAAEKEQEHDDDILEKASKKDKIAMSAWKADNPDDSLKHQRALLDKGLITKLPWEDYLRPEADFEDDAEAEAIRWALEQKEKRDALKAQAVKDNLERPGDYLSESESKKKDNDLDGENTGSTDKKNERRVEGYVQNAEQNESTIWQRVHKSKE